jgi:hypothetical protein
MAGFAAVTPDNKHLVIARLKQRQWLLKGATREYESYVDDAKNILQQTDLGAPPAIMQSTA